MGKIIKLNEDTFKRIVEDSLLEAKSTLKPKVIRKIYKVIQPLTSKMYKDNDWAGVTQLLKTIEDTIQDVGELNVRVENGGYWKPIGEFPNYKEYLITISLTDGGTINGSIKCHSAGTIEDTFKSYDITCELY